ncbi:hypothetical protein HG537_0H04000 [Torulaspora globosa]|uniref:Uncharacterized protein n=1 Tax=Torulaspora globosa TaxID=48254 RepID=A0A7H9I0C4_9SACH|nr:hypothetical protein HG537_0H04000 [Torulaspora sp. CBS 2947]
MVVDQEAIRKRFSQLEMDINNINKMIDDNLERGDQEVAEQETAQQETAEMDQEAAAQLPDHEIASCSGEIASDLAMPDHAVDQTTDTSEDFTGNVTSTSSISSPETTIFVPKTTAPSGSNAPEGSTSPDGTTFGSTTGSAPRSKNRFRVVSVGTPDSTRKPSGEPATDSDSISKLQKRLDYLTKKCIKLQKEINYLNDMNHKNTLSIEDKRKLSSAIEKLQEYLDKKTKEKYDLGVLVSRQLRKQIDRGENGQFWIGTK